MRPFAGAVFVVNHTPTRSLPRPPRDIAGYSAPLRMAMYTAKLVGEEEFARFVPRDLQVEIIYLLSLTAELASDQVDLLEDNKVFESSSDPGVMAEVREFLVEAQSCLGPTITSARAWRHAVAQGEAESANGTSAVMHDLILKLITASNAQSSTAYYSAKALSHLLPKLVDAHGWQNDGGEEWLTKLDILKPSTTNVLGATAILTGLEENLRTSKIINNLCNRLISDVAGATAESEKTPGLLVLLNASLAVYDEGDIPVAQNRLVFAVKQILSWTETLATSNSKIASEACRALQKLLPAIKDVYGPYWETSLAFCISIWNSNEDGKLSYERLPMIGMSLKLLSILRSLKDANDDLHDALIEHSDQISQALIHLLQLRRSKESQPLDYVDDLLSRLVVNIPSNSIKDLSKFYPLVASEFAMVQSAGFDVLHKALPEAQQQISVDVLLEKTGEQISPTL
jgi:hypothetical protein